MNKTLLKRSIVLGLISVVLAAVFAFVFSLSYQPLLLEKNEIPDAAMHLIEKSKHQVLTQEEKHELVKILHAHKAGYPKFQDVLRYAKSGWYWYAATPFLVLFFLYMREGRPKVLDLFFVFSPCFLVLFGALVLI